MNDFGARSAETFSSLSSVVNFAPSDIARRQVTSWNGIKTDAVQLVRREPFECRYRASDHLLIVTEHAERDDGETCIEGLPRSTLREFSRKLSFVPAGHRFCGWQIPRALTRVTYFYIDPNGPLLDPQLRFSEIAFKPRLFFFDRSIWETALKLKAQTGTSRLASRQHAEALSIVLAHELVQLNGGNGGLEPRVRGGLAGWQRRKVEQYIGEHFADDVSLATLARLVELSPYHFARAFKQAFGAPPHRYLATVRMQRARDLLAKPALSVTEIGRAVGFIETSSFSAAFRKLTGITPTEYRRRLD
jgi:AraC family transcriptional regulator